MERGRVLDQAPMTDDRNFEEIMADLNVPVEYAGDKKAVENVIWLHPRQKYRLKTERSVTVATTCLYFSSDFVDHVLKTYDHKNIVVGVGEYEGAKVLLFKPGKNNDYKVSRSATGSKILIGLLEKAGISKGRYELVKIKGGFMGVPVEVNT